LHRPLTEYSLRQKLLPLVVLGKVRTGTTAGCDQRCLLELKGAKLFCDLLACEGLGDFGGEDCSRFIICQTISSDMMKLVWCVSTKLGLASVAQLREECPDYSLLGGGLGGAANRDC
jgi:hypothetical protein